MMQKMNKKLNNIMKDTTEREKIRLFYELAKYILKETKCDEDDPDMETLYDDIANVVNDIDNL